MKAGKSWDRSTTQEPTRVQKKLTRMNDQAAHKGIIFLFLKKKWEFFWENANTTMPFLRFWHLPKSRKAGKSWDRLDVEIYNPTAYASAKKTYANAFSWSPAQTGLYVNPITNQTMENHQLNKPMFSFIRMKAFLSCGCGFVFGNG